MLKRILKWFGFFPEPIEMRGIVGVTEDGCYLVQGPDGKVTKSHPLVDRIQISGWRCTGCNSKPCVCDQLSNAQRRAAGHDPK